MSAIALELASSIWMYANITMKSNIFATNWDFKISNIRSKYPGRVCFGKS
ncbi:hypothetical protein DOY81_005551, partial [Sarcophaga bullata]